MACLQQTAPPQQRRSKDATAHPHQPGAHPDPPHPDRAHSLHHHPAKAKVKFPLRNRISPSWTGTWIVCSPQFQLTRSYHGSPTSCACLCDIGLATPELTVGILSRLHPATGLRRFSPLFYGRCAAAHGFKATCIQRAESSGGILATSFGGLQHFQGPHILYGGPSSPG
jgi:hypothetical protein